MLNIFEAVSLFSFLCINFYGLQYFFFISCKKETNSEYKSIKFNVGFNITSRFSDSYYDKTIGKRLIFFADPVSRKELKIFTDEGLLIKKVNLKKAVDYLQNIADISVVSVDTILLSSNQTNKVSIINSEGEVWKKIDLVPFMHNKKGDVYELYSSVMSNFLMNDELIFFSEWRDNILKTNTSDAYNFGVFSKFFTNNFKGPFFLKYRIFIQIKLKRNLG